MLQLTERTSLKVILVALILSVISTVVVWTELFNPFVTTKALWLRTSVALALPFYVHLLLVNPTLRPNFKNALTLAAIAYPIVALLATVLGVNRIRSFWGTAERMGGTYDLIHLTLLYFYCVLIAKAKGLIVIRRLLLLLVWMAALSSLYGVLVALGMPQWVPEVGLRSSSFYGNPGYFAGVLILPMALTLLFLHQAKAVTPRIGYFVLFALQFTGIIISGTRSALLGVLTPAFLAAVARIIVKRDSFSRYTSIALIGVPVASILLILGGQRSHSPLFQRLTSVHDDESKVIRMIEWRAAWLGFKERPLLGIGSGNYDVVSNKYFDKALYKYNVNSVRVDKPHNQLLEILVTMGLVGLLAYVGILVVAGFAFWKAFRSNVISGTGCVILIGGIVAYTIETFFWFDTQAASVTFYMYLGLASCLGMKTKPQSFKWKSSASIGMRRGAVVFLIAAGSVYAVVRSVGMTAVFLRDMKVATTTRDVRQASAYFEKAAAFSFVGDRDVIRFPYTVFVGHLLEQRKDEADVNLVIKTIDEAIRVSEQVTQQGMAEPRVWLGLAYLYLERSKLNSAPPDPRAYAAIQKAIALAPNEIEPLLMLAHYEALDNRPDQALHILLTRVPKSPLTDWRLALIYRDSHRYELAIQAADEALRLGYQFQPVELAWLINYYADRQDYAKVAELYKKAIAASSADYQLHVNLAATYDKLGERQEAIAEAQKALQLNPALEPYVERFLALPATRSVSGAQ